MANTQEDYEALLQFLYLAPVGLIQLTNDGTVELINPLSASLLMPLSREGNLDNLFVVLSKVAPDLHHLAESFTEPSGAICESHQIHIKAGDSGKSDLQVLSLNLYKLDENRLMAVISDITLQVKRERIVRQHEVWFNAVATVATDYALISLDAAGMVCEWNRTIFNLTGFSEKDVLGKSYSLFSPKEATTPEQVLDRLQEADRSGWSMDEGWRQKVDGGRFWGSMLIAPLRDTSLASGEPTKMVEDSMSPSYCLIIRDISGRRDASEQHRLETACDHLTGIANRRAFFEAADLEFLRLQRSPRDLSLVLFDADHFKTVNDTYGHPAGDAVLRHLAKLLTSTFRQVDVVARVGGEEFAVLLPSADLNTALKIANRLRENVEAQIVEIDGVEISFTVSAGVAAKDESIKSLDELMKRANQALYRAKALGRNRIEAHLGAENL